MWFAMADIWSGLVEVQGNRVRVYVESDGPPGDDVTFDYNGKNHQVPSGQAWTPGVQSIPSASLVGTVGNKK